MYKENEFIAKAAEAAGAPIIAHTEASLQLPGELLASSGLFAATRSALVFVTEAILEPGEAVVVPTRDIVAVNVVDDLLGAKLLIESARGELKVANIGAEQADAVLSACGLVVEPQTKAAETSVALPKMALHESRSPTEAASSTSAPLTPPPIPSARPRSQPTPAPSSAPPSPPMTAELDDESLLQLVEPLSHVVFGQDHVEASRGEEELYGFSESTDAFFDDTPQYKVTLDETNEDEPVELPKVKPPRTGFMITLAIGLAVLGGIVVFILQPVERGLDVTVGIAQTEAAYAPAVEGVWQEGQRLRTALPVVSINSPVTIFYRAFPGSEADWIAIATEGSPDDAYEQWYFLNGQAQGMLVASPLNEGRYELRGYYDWPDGGYVVRDRYGFSVQR